MKKIIGRLWEFVRELSGDDAYERYLAYHGTAHPHAPAMTRRAFYLSEQRRKWSGVQRCC
ncbi:hypothetical protein ACG33_12565 [Steroidobacter denitrificans]|uniref:YbdD/YjiX family protein n=2 Tax=Steroidobacter denitrificans TaxID=465721 RepID=A0A127FDW7_STEDE|nr:hypothetical protein ACG33_12565 [Steroidobacter denitrificans]